LTSREIMVLTNSFGIGLPLECASDGVAVAGDKDTQGAGAGPAGDQKLVFANNSHEGLDWPGRGVWDLSQGQELEEGGLIEIDHVVVLAVGVTERVAYSAGGEREGRSCGQGDFLEERLFRYYGETARGQRRTFW
jgi:hypothetical protein